MRDDDVWPRDDPDYRYRLYARRGHTLEVLACAPDAGGIGAAIVALDEDMRAVGGALPDVGVIGILDVADGPRGRWILLPWQRGQQPTERSL